MPTFIKTGYWEKLQKGYKGWLNLDEFFIGKSTAASAGQIAFFDSSNTITGSSSLFWDNTNGRLGIGTNSPLYTLHILKPLGSGSLDAVFKTEDTTATSTLYIDNNLGRGFRIQTFGSAVAGTLLDGTINRAGTSVIRTNESSNNIVIGGLSNSAAYVYFGQNNISLAINNATQSIVVGSGTFATGIKFDVNGTGRVQGMLTAYGLDLYSVTSAGGGADYFYVDNDPNLSAGANNQTIALMRFRDRGSNGAFTGVNRLGLIMEISAGGSYPFQLFSESGNIRIGYAAVASTTTKLSLKGSTNDNTARTLDIENAAGSPVLRTYNGIQVLVGSSTPAASTILQADSTTQGFLPPRMTTAQKTAIVTPPAGLVVYDTGLNKLCVYTGAAWQTITSA